MPMDQYGRSINYLRISLTDMCNLRCVYCMPTDMTFAGGSRLERSRSGAPHAQLTTAYLTDGPPASVASRSANTASAARRPLTMAPWIEALSR